MQHGTLLMYHGTLTMYHGTFSYGYTILVTREENNYLISFLYPLQKNESMTKMITE